MYEERANPTNPTAFSFVFCFFLLLLFVLASLFLYFLLSICLIMKEKLKFEESTYPSCLFYFSFYSFPF